MKLTTAVTLGLIGLTLASCAEYKSDRQADVAAFEKVSPNIQNYSRMAFASLTIPYESDFNVTSADPVFQFAEGPSHFKAFELPNSNQPYKLAVYSKIVGDGCYPCKSLGTYFYQRVLFLDAERKPIDAPSVPDLRYPMGWNNVPRTLTYKIPAASPAKYFVVYTTMDDVRNGGVIPGGVSGGTMISPSPGVFVPIGGTDGEFHPGSPIGVIGVRISTDG